jgi:hypothetical protein
VLAIVLLLKAVGAINTTAQTKFDYQPISPGKVALVALSILLPMFGSAIDYSDHLVGNKIAGYIVGGILVALLLIRIAVKTNVRTALASIIPLAVLGALSSTIIAGVFLLIGSKVRRGQELEIGRTLDRNNA